MVQIKEKFLLWLKIKTLFRVFAQSCCPCLLASLGSCKPRLQNPLLSIPGKALQGKPSVISRNRALFFRPLRGQFIPFIAFFVHFNFKCPYLFWAAEGAALSTAAQLAWAQPGEALEEQSVAFEGQDTSPACPGPTWQLGNIHEPGDSTARKS